MNAQFQNNTKINSTDPRDEKHLLISDVLDKIKAGLQYASNYLETAKDIAELVSKSLGHKQQQQKRGEDERDEARQPSFGPSNLVSAFFRLIGFDSPKIAAIAVNSVIFLAQMVKTPRYTLE